MHIRPPARAWRRAILCSLLCAAALDAQVTWASLRGSPIGRRQAAMAYDERRQVAVLFSGRNRAGAAIAENALEWSGSGWVWRGPATASTPPARANHAMAYDAARGVVLVFGGARNTTIRLADTWEWDGRAWTQRAPATSPPAREGHAMMFDAARGVVVLFGGRTGPSFFGDTWLWDGDTWSQAATTGPAPRSGCRMAFDALRRRVVLFGGGNATTGFADTWEWDGAAWTQIASANTPGPRASPAFAFDPRRGTSVLFGGLDLGGIHGDTWEWNGSDWTQLAVSGAPPARLNAVMAYDTARGELVLFGGEDPAISFQFLFDDTWRLSGSTWVKWSPPDPPARQEHALAYDPQRARAVLFGGTDSTALLADTWDWDGSAWTARATAVAPGARTRHAMSASDTGVLLFGGAGAAGRLDDTWEWDGSAWAQCAPSVAPPARSEHALAHDRGRGVVVLYGGTSDAGPLADTWEWDGSNWTQRQPATSPGPRAQHALAYDRRRGVVVLFGGAASNDDTWEWNGTDWTLRAPVTRPPALAPCTLAYDAARDRTVLAFSEPSAVFSDEVWEWNGADWSRRIATNAVTPRVWTAMAYDEARRQIVVFGGAPNGAPPSSETSLCFPVDAADYAPFGTGCAGSAGVPRLDLAPFWLPWIGGVFALQLEGLAPGAPAAVAFGLSNAAWGALPLPYPLALLGRPDCLLLVSAEVCVPVTNVAGTALYALQVHADPLLIGASFHNQGLVFDAAAPGQIAVSNAATGTIGAR
jgi:hypothetical protein